MLFCPICGDEWLIYNTLCQDCRKIKHTMNLVGKDRFLECVDRLFILGETKTNKILEKEELKDTKKGLGIITRSQLKDKL